MGIDTRRWRVTARNLAGESENRIHDDAVARDFGFRGGLVPGVTTYAYMTRPVVEEWGKPWLASGSMSVRFVAPVYDGDEIVVTARRTHGADDAARDRSALEVPTLGVPALDLEVTNLEGQVCARGQARLGADPARAPVARDYPNVAPPLDRRPVTREVLGGLATLGSVQRTFRLGRAAEYLDAIGDDSVVYEQVAHPGWIILDANEILVRNVLLGPWVHVQSEVQHFSSIGDGDMVSTRGRIAALFGRGGHEFVELDLAVFAGEPPHERAVWAVHHTAIYHLARPA